VPCAVNGPKAPGNGVTDDPSIFVVKIGVVPHALLSGLSVVLWKTCQAKIGLEVVIL